MTSVFATAFAFDDVHKWTALANNPGNPAMFDWGTYVNGGRPDPTWCVLCVGLCFRPSSHGDRIACTRHDATIGCALHRNEIDQIFEIGPNGA